MNKRRKAARGIYASLFETSWGFGGVVASEAGILEVFLPFAGSGREEMAAHIAALYPVASAESPLTKKAAQLLRKYFAGEMVAFELPIDGAAFTPFQSAVYAAVATVPYGETRSYGEVARRVGSPRAARGVGGAMAANPLPVIVPCHRVVGSTGALTGYSGPGGIESKSWLLAMEHRKPVEKTGE